ncbi:fungal-specific transcription factor domain-containing protein [Auriculariales sp. MPI-PUGE-AT-0066]|nr:fungal-specific transcription factor domain-containing protein [Auriculariales sp. MPI-PUGE-AT-0066]
MTNPSLMLPMEQLQDAYQDDDAFDDGQQLQQDETPKRNRKRQSQSCDACRARKVRCSRREDPITDDTLPQEPCKHCTSLGVPCTFDYKPKKRGPPNLYLRRLKEMQSTDGEGGRELSPPEPVASTSRAATRRASMSKAIPSVPGAATVKSAPQGESPTWKVTMPGEQQQQQLQPETSAYPGQSDPGNSSVIPFAEGFIPNLHIPPSLYPIAADTFSPGHASAPASAVTTIIDDFSIFDQMSLSPMPVFPPLRHLHRPHAVDTVAPREHIEMILGLFFDFVYPLTPCIHQPSFLADFAAHREESDPIFFALVMSTVASTLVQLPRSYLPMSRAEVRQLAQSCHEASRHVTVGSYDPPTSALVVIRYLDTVYHFCLGNDATSHASFGEAQHIAVTLHMHEEASYEGLDPIECEMRRRAFWLLFGADKSMSILLGRPICLRDEDCTLLFPKEVDDEYITSTGFLPQPPGKTAVVSGLNYITRIFALLGEILVRIRVDKRSPPQGPFLTARLDEVRSLHQRILSALAHAPPALRLKPANVEYGAVASLQQQLGYPSGPGALPGSVPSVSMNINSAYAQQTVAQVREFFDNPNAPREQIGNHFLVMQANIYVTQQLVRFVIEQYRDELLTNLQQTMGVDPKELEASRAHDREQVAADLLKILHSIPIQSIATNGPSLVHKVRFVASTLLDTLRNAEEQPVNAARAHAFLWDFLSILSEIERNYLLDDEREMPPDSQIGPVA